MKKILLALILSFISITPFIHAKEPQIINYSLRTSDNTQLHAKLTDKGWEFETLNNQAIFIVIFGHHCPPCLAEIPSLIQAVEKHGDKLSIVAIEAQGLDFLELQEFKKKNGVNYTLLTRENKENDYFFRDIASKLDWKGDLPFLIAIDKYGEVKETQLGMVSYEKIESLVQILNQ